MKKFSRRNFLKIVGATTAVTSLAACGQDSSSTTQTDASQSNSTQDILKEKVNLIMYVLGGQPDGFDEVMKKLNEKLLEDLNAELTVNFLSWGDWQTKYPLILASGEQIDLIYTSDWAYYSDQVRLGAFADLTNLLQTNAPDLYNAFTEEEWAQTFVDGCIYMTPQKQKEYDVLGIIYRKDWGDAVNAPEITDWKTFEEYCAAIKAGMPDVIPYNAGSQDINYFQNYYPNSKPEQLIDLFREDINVYVDYTEFDDPDMQPWIMEYQDDYLDYLKERKAYRDAGYWSKSVLANDTTSGDAFDMGTSAIAAVNLESANNSYRTLKENFPDAEVGFWNVCENRKLIMELSNKANGMAIPNVSQNKERAIMLLEKLYLDKEYNHLTQYGIEGVSYTIDENGAIVQIDGAPAAVGIGGGWAWGNDDLKLHAQVNMPGYFEMKEEYATRSFFYPMGSFNPVLDSISAEYAAVANVTAQYRTPLAWGMIEDVEAGYKELLDQLKIAGYDTVIDELALQFREHAATL